MITIFNLSRDSLTNNKPLELFSCIITIQIKRSQFY